MALIAAARRSSASASVHHRAVPQAGILFRQGHELAGGDRGGRRGGLRSAASGPAGPALRLPAAAASPPAARARSLRWKVRATRDRCRRDRTSLRRRRHRSHPAPAAGVRADSSRSGTRKGMPLSRILALARTRRWPMAAGETRKAEAMAAASKPRTVCSIKGARTASSMAGWAQANSSFSRSSGIFLDHAAAVASPIPPPARSRCGDEASRRVSRRDARRWPCAWRRPSARLRDCRECRVLGQCASAEAKASARASSAAATSRVRAARKATSLP